MGRLGLSIGTMNACIFPVFIMFSDIVIEKRNASVIGIGFLKWIISIYIWEKVNA